MCQVCPCFCHPVPERPYLTALVDDLVHGPPSAVAPPQVVSKSGSRTPLETRRSVTPTVPPSETDDSAVAVAPRRPLLRDSNGNRVVGDAAVDRPVEMIVAAATYGHKRRSTHLHQSASSGESGEIGDGCGNVDNSREKRPRLDP